MKKKNVIPGNTQRANNDAAKTLKAYLAEIWEEAFERFRVCSFLLPMQRSRGHAPRVIQPSDCEI